VFAYGKLIDSARNSRKDQRMNSATARPLKLDEIGKWSVLKLEILRQYSYAYSTILTKHQFHHSYIDGFAGAGQHILKRTKELIPGSPWNALNLDPPFRELHLIDLDRSRTTELRRLSQGLPNVSVQDGDANEILLKLFPEVRYEQYRRALCILDPYGLHLHWKVIEAAGKMGTIEIFLNFPVHDMNRNVLWWNPDLPDPEDVARMNMFWGDESWRTAAYSAEGNLFKELEKQPNEIVAEAFRQRLKRVAGFQCVPEPIPMKNSNGATIYYLFFAAQEPLAEKIATDIFKRTVIRNMNG
jgi:three-Cys-motif partner protein